MYTLKLNFSFVTFRVGLRNEILLADIVVQSLSLLKSTA